MLVFSKITTYVGLTLMMHFIELLKSSKRFLYSGINNRITEHTHILFKSHRNNYLQRNFNLNSNRLHGQHVFWCVFYRSTFVRSAWSFVFSSPPQRPLTSNIEGFFIPDFIHYIYFPILILEKEPVFPFLMFSAKQGNYWHHFYNVFGMTRSLNRDWTRDLPHSKPALYH